MKIFLDTSDVEVIRHHHKTGLIDGVTTNPTLMASYGKNPVEVIKEISEIFDGYGASISAEVMSETEDEMLEEAEQYYNLSHNVTIKLPCTYEGLKACRKLSDFGVSTNVTLVFSVSQAILAAKAGASLISPFIGRVEDQRFDPLVLIQSIYKVYDNQGIVDTEILAASTRSVYHVEKAFEYGADVVTMPPTVFEKMYHHMLTDSGLEQFKRDWGKLSGV